MLCTHITNEALGTWVEESLLKHIYQAPFYSIMADECTDVSTVEELSLLQMDRKWSIYRAFHTPFTHEED